LGTFLILVALALIIGAALLRKREEANRIRLGLIFAALAALGLGLIIRSGTSEPDLQEYEELAGYRLGKLLLERVDGRGPILVLRSPTDLQSEEPTAGRCRGLRSACSSYTVIEAGPDPLELGPPSDDFQILEGENWTEEIVPWCDQYPSAVAVVSLLFEFPPLATVWDQDLPLLYGFASGPSSAWTHAMRAGQLQAVVRYKPVAGAPSLPPRGASPEQAFDHHFELVTPENLEGVLGNEL